MLGNACSNGLTGTVDYEAAVEWFREAAKLGNAYAQYNLGCCYEHGHGVEKDLVQAAAWYSEAAKRNNRYALYALGRCYEEGWGVVRDRAAARRYYRQAESAGLLFASEKLKQMDKLDEELAASSAE